MELARHAWRKTILVYKGSLQNALRNRSDGSSSSVTQQAVLGAAITRRTKSDDEARSSNADDETKITDAGVSSIPRTTIPKDEQQADDERISDALGATDELSSYIGLAREFACDSKVEHPYVDKLKRVQMILFDLNNTISRAGKPSKVNTFETKHTKDLEEWIFEYANQLPPPEDFIIPGGGKACASLHVARTICRRAERTVSPLVREGTLDVQAQVYLNRLSEFLLTVSRMAAKCDQRTENIYIPRTELTAPSQDK